MKESVAATRTTMPAVKGKGTSAPEDTRANGFKPNVSPPIVWLTYVPNGRNAGSTHATTAATR